MSAQPVLPAYSMNRPSFPWMYERALVEPLFRPWAELLLERVMLTPRSSVIDVACGTGIVARLARQRAGHAARIVGVDVSAPMLDVAREIDPSIDWREGDAANLPVGADERFDRALCQQGLQFFSNRQAAAGELRRVLAPDGMLIVAVWRAADEVPLFRELQRVAERHVGTIYDQRYAFGDQGALRDLLGEGGFRDIDIEVLSLPMRFPDGREFVRMNAMALLGMSKASVRDDERERLLDLLVREGGEAARPFADGAALICEMRANVAVAR